jgi:hypothetical protein
MKSMGILSVFMMLFVAFAVQAQPSAIKIDQRQLVEYPKDAREEFLENMRDHLVALADIVTALATRNYIEAANIASSRLGMESRGADGCRPMKSHSSMDMMRMHSQPDSMALMMPGDMKKLGQRMHRFADEFAEAARNNTDLQHDDVAVLAALGKLVQACSDCHSKFRIR